MIYHHNRLVFKAVVTAEQRDEALASLRTQGREIDAVQQFVVGRDVGGDFAWGATFVLADLDGYWEYLMHPAHAHTDEIGLPLVEKFISYDTTDDPDPEIGARIAELHRRRYAERPELTRLVRDLPSYTGSGAPEPRA
jgi:stress responsive alpha/beta barrel protein